MRALSPPGKNKTEIVIWLLWAMGRSCGVRTGYVLNLAGIDRRQLLRYVRAIRSMGLIVDEEGAGTARTLFLRDARLQLDEASDG